MPGRQLLLSWLAVICTQGNEPLPVGVGVVITSISCTDTDYLCPFFGGLSVRVPARPSAQAGVRDSIVAGKEALEREKLPSCGQGDISFRREQHTPVRPMGHGPRTLVPAICWDISYMLAQGFRLGYKGRRALALGSRVRQLPGPAPDDGRSWVPSSLRCTSNLYMCIDAGTQSSAYWYTLLLASNSVYASSRRIVVAPSRPVHAAARLGGYPYSVCTRWIFARKTVPFLLGRPLGRILQLSYW